MSSKQYHLGYLRKQKANLKNQIRKRKPSDNQSEASDIMKDSYAYQDDSYVTIKTQMLGRKLKMKDNKSTTQFSRFTFLKQSRSLQEFKATTSKDLLTSLKDQKERIFEEREYSLQLLEQNLLKTTLKHGKFMHKLNLLKNENSVELGQIFKLIEQLQQKSKSQEVNKYTNKPYYDILNRSKKESNQIFHKLYSKKSLQIYKQPSLLQSFKRNFQQEDGCVTLKYSQQSNRKERSQPNQTLPQGWDSFRKDNLKNTLFKSANKGEIQKFDNQEDQFTTVKDTIVQHLYYQKCYLVSQHNQSQKIIQQFQGVLEQIIEQVAYQKVQQDELLKTFETQKKEDIIEISALISKIKMEQMQQRFNFEAKIKSIQESLSDSLAEEKYVRKSQQKYMIKMMMQVVEFFN